MRNIKLVLEYDGSAFFGFQKQPHQPTIQESLETALTSFFGRRMKIAAASGRTDAGVHAAGQVVNFKTSNARELEKIQRGLNALLPHSIVVKRIEEVPADFHARYSICSKTYEYSIWNHPLRSPLVAGRVLHVIHPLEVIPMRRAARSLIGTHDFRSFTSVAAFKHRSISCVRTIKKISIQKQRSLIRIRVEADGFLYHMVRNIVGTLIEVGKGKRSPEEITAILEAKDRRFAGMTAPSVGLMLLKASY
ncbi:MAG: tRNA pseudouridine(38-40) synthase TruA [Candidatus Omnitrophica bacterium]|nr:tRNA pseudouridine(38-40) synthase TruA [Candidatus Omnitrophota bacterium]